MIRSHETESLTNKMSKDKIIEKNQSYKRIKKIQGEKKNLIRGQTKLFNWRVKLNWKITLTK
jgi:hypothetical protein